MVFGTLCFESVPSIRDNLVPPSCTICSENTAHQFTKSKFSFRENCQGFEYFAMVFFFPMAFKRTTLAGHLFWKPDLFPVTWASHSRPFRWFIRNKRPRCLVHHQCSSVIVSPPPLPPPPKNRLIIYSVLYTLTHDTIWQR